VERHESQVDRARGRVHEARQRLKHPMRAGIDLHDERLVTWQSWLADSIAQERISAAAMLVGMLRESER
jgi:hypothetical protein